ncbi:helix-turn-helix domain-containing protein [Saccharopolyspora hattusasensis]|uniref:helix-turn-helix domain-containing protein n=1 Tax=Saccharopolyspora hattusasensis TaxID=1128679 RepID=UPI003D9972AD
MAKDWRAVATAINTRMEQLELTQQEVANRAGVALHTVRELQHNLVERKRTARTLEAMSEALGLPRQHLAAVLDGRTPPATSGSSESSGLDDLYAKLADITQRLEAIERKLPKD